MCVCVRETFLAKCPLLGGIAPILQGKLHLGHSHEVSFLPWEAGLPKQKENLGERQLEAAQHPPPPKEAHCHELGTLHSWAGGGFWL